MSAGAQVASKSNFPQFFLGSFSSISSFFLRLNLRILSRALFPPPDN
jgi:hypothetical protein